MEVESSSRTPESGIDGAMMMRRIHLTPTVLKIVAVGVGLLLLGLAGCQIGQLPGPQETLDDNTFMKLWEIYQHCRSSTDLEAMSGDLQRLKHGASLSIPGTEVRIPLPLLIARHITPPGSRLAVDPQAMALACALRTGEVALETGHNRFAAQLFRSTLHKLSGPEHAFYAIQARHGLTLATQRLYGPCVVSIQQDGTSQREEIGQAVHSAVPPGKEEQSATQGIFAGGFAHLGAAVGEQESTGCKVGPD